MVAMLASAVWTISRWTKNQTGDAWPEIIACKCLTLLVPGEGVEPTRYLYHRILSPKKALFGTVPYKRIRVKTT